jgi:transmembrane 9 superfamily protein 2/4
MTMVPIRPLLAMTQPTTVTMKANHPRCSRKGCLSLLVCLLFCAVTLLPSGHAVRAVETAVATTRKRLSRKERKERNQNEAKAYLELREQGVDEVGHTTKAAALRHYQLRKKKRKGILRKREANLAEVLFPGVAPELYEGAETVFMFTDLVQSKKTHVPFEFYDLPSCDAPVMNNFRRKHKTQRKNLGARLQGVELKPAPYVLKILQNINCMTLCERNLGFREVKSLRKLVERQYRVHFTFDQLPVLMRSSELNYAVRGYPVGFKAPPSYTGLDHDEFYLYNHLKFTITYQPGQGDESSGVYITGFDVHPVSIRHGPDTCSNDEEDGGPINDPSSYLPLTMTTSGQKNTVAYSYSVEWIESALPWADRWDVYLIGSPDDDIHFFAIVNSLMIVLFLTGAIATIMIRTLKKDISSYNEMSMLEDGGAEETGWKLVHGDVFRPPSTSPMALSVLVGTGAQIGTAFFISMLSAVFKLLNPMRKGQTLTAILILYVLCGSVGGYVSARIYKFCDAKAWKMNAILTATALPGTLVSIFTVLNIFLSIAGAATAVSFWVLLALFLLWTCVSAPLVFVGSFFGLKQGKIEIPSRVNQIARVVPPLPWYSSPPISFLLGGVLPFGSVCIELFFIMSALWLHQIYYVMGFLLAVLIILAATCAQVSIVMDYLQLCSEDHRWWWKSFGNCASGGVYLFGYSLWFLVSRLDLVGVLPVVVYLTYMSMISLLFGVFCGSVGFLCSFWFNQKIYAALKVD